MGKNISILGVSMDLGQSRRGVNMGPDAIRYAGIVERLEKIGHFVVDNGNITVYNNNINNSLSTNLKNLDAVLQTNIDLQKQVNNIIKNQAFPLILGGDHSIAIGTLAGLAQNYSNLGVIWFDAHGDLNLPDTSPSGNIHGMPLAISLGYGHPALVNIGGKAPKVKPENVVMIGIRDLDDGEKELINQIGLKVYTMHEIDKLGMNQVILETIDYLKKTDGIHLSLDLDGLDPLDCPGVGTPVNGGISYRESHLAMEMLADTKLITSAEFVEVNPILDDRNKTAKVAVDLIGSLLGEKILKISPPKAKV